MIILLVVVWVPGLKSQQSLQHISIFSVDGRRGRIETNPSEILARVVELDVAGAGTTIIQQFHQHNRIDSLRAFLIRGIPIRGWKECIPDAEHLNRFDMRQSCFFACFARRSSKERLTF